MEPKEWIAHLTSKLRETLLPMWGVPMTETELRKIRDAVDSYFSILHCGGFLPRDIMEVIKVECSQDLNDKNAVKVVISMPRWKARELGIEDLMEPEGDQNG